MKGIKRILVIEDNDDDFDALMMAVEDGLMPHIPVTRCATGSEARAAFQHMRETSRPTEETPRLILLDLKLPDAAGHDLLTEIKSDPRLREIPVIVFSSSSNGTDIRDSYQIGANSFVRKPLDLDGFTMMVGRLRDFWLGTAELPVPS